mmetsp:Transcript_43143/g.115378  ORF Transcript_43143/g.115378 Transcript_43143/m.115378 type:complete len:240 (-) Transcript_43143:193-912(-)
MPAEGTASPAPRGNVIEMLPDAAELSTKVSWALLWFHAACALDVPPTKSTRQATPAKSDPVNPGRDSSTRSPPAKDMSGVKLTTSCAACPATGGSSATASVPLNDPTACTYWKLVASTGPVLALVLIVTVVWFDRSPTAGRRGDPDTQPTRSTACCFSAIAPPLTSVSCEVLLDHDTANGTSRLPSTALLCHDEPVNPGSPTTRESPGDSAMLAVQVSMMSAHWPASAGATNSTRLDRK